MGIEIVLLLHPAKNDNSGLPKKLAVCACLRGHAYSLSVQFVSKGFLQADT